MSIDRPETETASKTETVETIPGIPAEAPLDPEADWGRTPEHQKAGPVLAALTAGENVLILLLLAATVLTILAQIVFRRFLDQPLSWSTEVATTLLVYVAFVGFAIGVRDNVHVAMRAFEDRFGPHLQTGTRVLELLVLGVVVAAIGIGGAVYALEQKDVVTPAGMPLWTAFAALPLGCALGCLHVVIELVAVLRGRVEASPAAVPQVGGVA